MFNWWIFTTKSLILCWLLVAQSAFATNCGKATSCGVLFESARKLYNEHKHEEALTQFQDAYAMSKAPIILVFIGCAMHSLNRYEEAIKSFRVFLQERPRSLHATKVRAYLAKSELRRNPVTGDPDRRSAIFSPRASPPMDARGPEPTDPGVPFDVHPAVVTHLPAPVDKAASARSNRILVTLGAVSVGIGLAGIIAGGSCYGALVSLQNKINTSNDEFAKQDLLAQAEHLKSASTASYVVGGLLLGTGIGMLTTLGVKMHSKRSANAPLFRLAMQAGPGYLGASLRGSF